MAKVQPRTRADGGTSYRVMWVIDGGRPRPGARPGEPGSQASETFTDKKMMQAFKAAVEIQGHRWPLGWVKGRGWVADEPTTEEPDPIASSPSTTCTPRPAHRADLRAPTSGPGFTAMTSAGAAAKSVHNRHAILHAVMAHGCRELGRRPDNPCVKTPLPRDAVDRQIRFFTHGEWTVLRRCLRSDVHLLIDVALTTGLRWGELSALRVGDLSRPTGEELVLNLHIVRAWSKRDTTYDDSPIDVAAGETVRHKLGPTKNRKDR